MGNTTEMLLLVLQGLKLMLAESQISQVKLYPEETPFISVAQHGNIPKAVGDQQFFTKQTLTACYQWATNIESNFKGG